MNSLRLLAAPCVLAVSLSLALAVPAAAQPEEQPIPEQAVVKLFASGIATTGGRKCAESMGVVVSRSGLVLTVYHLLRALGDVEPGSVEIIANKTGGDDVCEEMQRAEGEAVGSGATRAWPVDAKPHVDLLLLKLSQLSALGEDIEPAAIAQVAALSEQPVELRSYGIDISGSADLRERFEVASFIGARGLWTISSTHSTDEASGLPFFDRNGRLLALLSSFKNKSGSEVRYIIPTNYADALLVGLRFNEIRTAMESKFEQRLADFDPLREEFSWKATRTGDEIVIEYKKLVRGEPLADKIKAKLLITATRRGGAVERLPDMLKELPEAQRGIDQRSGVFSWQTTLAALEQAYKEQYTDFGYLVEIEGVYSNHYGKWLNVATPPVEVREREGS